MMFQTLTDCIVGLKDIMDNSSTTRASFGLECNNFKDPDMVFRKYKVNRWQIMKLIL
jgi:hypothetical protein